MGLIPEGWFLRRSDAERAGDLFPARSRSARASERILESKERVSLEALAGGAGRGRSRRPPHERTLVLETKYGPKTYPLDELLHLYLTEGEHKTDILEHLKEEAL